MFYDKGLRVSPRGMILFAADGILIMGSLLVASMIRLGQQSGWNYFSSHHYTMFSSTCILLVVFYITGLHDRQVLFHKKGSLAGISIATGIGLVLMIVLFYLRGDIKIGRGILPISGLCIIISTWLFRRFYALGSGHGLFKKNTLIVGAAEESRRVIQLIQNTNDSGIKLFGVVTQEPCSAGIFIDGFPVLGQVDMLKEFSRVYDVESIVVATSLNREPSLLRILRPLRYSGVEILDYAGLHEQLGQEIPVDHIDDEWLMHAAMNSSRIHIRKIKRIMDLLAATVGLTLAAPIVMVTAVLVRLDSSGPVLFRQRRAGLDGQPYTLYKFRTMREDAETESGAIWSGRLDSRVTRIGKYLRKSRIDEIPQLWNVLLGEMSLVGPRPERPEFIESLAEAIPFYKERLLVPPGITGWAQINFPYAASIESSRQKLQFDLYYIKHMSFFLDSLILLRTIRTILVGLRHHEDFDQVDRNNLEEEEKVIRVLPSQKNNHASRSA